MKNIENAKIIAEIAEDLQLERGYPSVDAMKSSGMLRCYSLYNETAAELDEEELDAALEAGFRRAEAANEG